MNADAGGGGGGASGAAWPNPYVVATAGAAGAAGDSYKYGYWLYGREWQNEWS